jgi:protein required for attachment to host cells
MDNLWIVVAHQSGARIYSRNRPSDGLRLIEKWDHPEGWMRDHDINSDKPGRTGTPTPSPASTGMGSAGRGPRRHALTPRVMPHEAESIRFSQHLAPHLEKARAQNRYFRLVLVAGPDEMGLLHGALDKQTREKIIAHLNKNLAQVKDSEMENHIFDVLADADEKLAVQRSA